MILRRRNRRDHQRELHSERRRKLARQVARKPWVEMLEDRRLLATLTVNTNLDTVNDGDGVLSLREAMLIANDSSGGTSYDGINSTDVADTIVFDSTQIAASDAIVLGGSELPAVSQPLTINGALVGTDRVKIDGNDASRIFVNNSQLDLLNADLANGFVTGLLGGAVLNSGTSLTVSGVSISDSEAAAGFGGAIASTQGTVTLTATRLTNNRAVGGGGIHLEAGTATISFFGVVQNNTATQSGGGIFVNAGATLTLADNVTIAGNSALGGAVGEGGGGIYNSGTLTLNGAGATADPRIELTGNSANIGLGSGGAIFNAGALSINNAIIGVDRAGAAVGNTAQRAGGGIEHTATSTLIMTGVDLSNNAAAGLDLAPGNGGGLHVTGSGNVTINGGSVRNNTAAEEGGGLWNDSGTMTVTGTTISGNMAEGDGVEQGGGGIFNTGGTVQLIGATVSNNIATAASVGNGGGGIFNDGSMTLTNTTVSGNEANTGLGNGGGILNSDGGTLNVNGGAITGNTAARAGGGIENNGGSITLTNATVQGNNAGINGGGIHVSGAGTTNVSGGSFRSNVAGQEGGGLWNSSDGTMVINNAAISQNTASGAGSDQGGGGVFNAGGTINISNASITGNAADGSNGSGGGILNDAGGTVTVSSSVIESNTASRAGGGIEVTGSTMEINQSSIVSNTTGSSPGNGGGIHLTGASVVDIVASTFASNAAANEGGGLWNSSTGTINLTNSTVSSNVANGATGGGGVFNQPGGVFNIQSSTITLNQAPNGPGDGIEGSSSGLTLQNTIVAQNPGSGVEQNLSGTILSDDFNLIGDADAGNLTGALVNTVFEADALLLPLANYGGPTFTHFPAAGSPAIGNGWTDLAVDQRGVTRPQGGDDDIGAVEVNLNGIVIDAGDGVGDGLGDDFLIINDDQGITGDILVYVNSQLRFSLPKATTGQIFVRGSSDDDTLTIDNSNGLIGAAILFDGDGISQVQNAETPVGPGGLDTLRLIGTTPTTTTYNPGATVDAGMVYQEQNEVIQRVQFFGLEPVQVVGTGAADTLNVAGTPLGIGFPQALNGDNTINYTVGPNSDDPFDPVFGGAITGLITVDGFESLEFAGFGTMNIDAGPGSDFIHLNHEEAPDDLTRINVNGGDPTASSDTVVVNGTAARDEITVEQLSIDGATVIGAQPVEVHVTTTENLIVNGKGGNDDLRFIADDSDEVEFIPDVYEDSGTFVVSSDSFGPTQRLIPFSYRDLGAGGQVFVDSTSGNRNLDFRVFGTDAGDRFDVSPSGQVRLRKGDSSFLVSLPLNVNGVDELFLEGLGGDDEFRVNGNHPFTSGVRVRGGSPSDSGDVLTFTGSGAGAVTLNLSNRTIAEAGFGLVSFAEVESVMVQANEALTVVGTNQNDIFDVSPVGSGTSGMLVHSGSAPVFHYAGASSVTIEGSGGNADQLNLHGNDVANTITSTADTVTLDAISVTLGAGLESLQILAGGGDDSVDLSSLVFEGQITILGGDGNDTLIGSNQADHVFGGAGNDILIGRGGDDYQYGEEGDDIFGNPTLTADGTADDPGVDRNFGGNGVDNFIWEPGDGADFNSGGDDGADIFRIFGSDGLDNVVLRSGATPTHFNAVFNATVIDNHGIEDVLVDALGESDTVEIQDLFATEVVNVTVHAEAGNESITVFGRSVADDLAIRAAAANRVAVQGLSYDINILDSTTDDSLNVFAGGGDDTVIVHPGVDTVLTTRLLGEQGSDTLSGSFTSADGGAGNDLLLGGPNDNELLGGAGEDTLIGGGGDDTIDGGEDFDTILIAGTSGNDVIDVYQALPTELRYTVNGDAQVDTLVAGTVEEARITAGAGADLIRVNWLDAHAVNGAIDALRMTVDGGSDATSDRLVVVDDGQDDLVLYRKGQADDTGTVEIGPGNEEPLLTVFTGIETVNFVDEAGNAIVNDPEGPQLVVFKHDPFETNDNRFIATFLGGGATINVDPTIDPGALSDPFGDGFDLPGDHDFYRLVATKTGILDFQVYFRQVAELASGRPGLPGNGNLDINVRDAQGNIITGFGTNDADDDERVRIPVVAGQTYYLEVFGAANAVNVYSLSFVNEAPPVPYALELDDNPINGQTNPPGTQTDNSDTGRSQFDNHTYDNTPTIYFRLDDGIFLHDLPGNGTDGNPPDEVIPIPFRAGTVLDQPGYAIAIFDEGNTPPQTGTAPQTPLGFASAVPGQEGVYVFTVPEGMALSEGSHFLTARVQMIDPAVATQTGFGGRSLPLEIVVDRTPPAVAFGLAGVDGDGLHPDSNSGDPFLAETLADLITNDLTPTFFGRAEANAIVRAYLDLEDEGFLLIGQTVATPYDGTEQLETPLFPDEPGGQWELTSTVSMNDPRVVEALGRDGLRRILVTAEDVAGNISVADEAGEILELFIDTQGPQVDGVFVTDREDFNLFTLKPETPEPTPAVHSLTIRVIDFPERFEPFFYSAISNVPPLAPIVLVGDHTGVIAIDTIEYIDVNTGPGFAVGEIVMTFDEPLPDDRYTLTLSDNIIDPAGNQLDGENNAVEPIGDPFFPTGDLIPGGDFIARFTVDSRPEIATWSQGVVYADINGNFVWDPEGQDNDATNRDFVFNFGEVTDAYFTGNFAANRQPGTVGTGGTGGGYPMDPNDVPSSGFDKLGAYGAFNGQYQFFLDTDDDGVGDYVGAMAYQVNAIPVAGNFYFSEADWEAVDQGRRPRDEIGAFDGHNWYLDVNGNNQIDSGEKFPTQLRGIPVVGDFNGDGLDDLATYNNDSGIFYFDLDFDGTVDDQLFFGFSGFGERPVVGDINLDGIDDLVMWVPRQDGQLPKEAGEFHFLVSDHPFDFDNGWHPESEHYVVLPSDVFDPYSPAPLGNDLVAQFGDDFALPLFGNFDPPVDGGSSGTSFLGSLTNELNPLDTTLDGQVTARDALVVINALGRVDFEPNANPLRLVASLGGYRLDASQDGTISSLDALRVINALGQQPPLLSSESADSNASGWASLADQVMAGTDDDDDDMLDVLASDIGRIF